MTNACLELPKDAVETANPPSSHCKILKFRTKTEQLLPKQRVMSDQRAISSLVVCRVVDLGMLSLHDVIVFYGEVVSIRRLADLHSANAPDVAHDFPLRQCDYCVSQSSRQVGNTSDLRKRYRSRRQGIAMVPKLTVTTTLLDRHIELPGDLAGFARHAFQVVSIKAIQIQLSATWERTMRLHW